MITTDVHEEQHNWTKDIAPYQRPSVRKSAWQLVNTIVPFFALWVLAYLSLSVSVWITLALTVPAAGFLIRIFIIFHDCCHHSFFKSRWANEAVGVMTGALTLMPYHQWKYEHSVHHASNGKLNRRGIGDVFTLTVDEYLVLSKFRRLCYRLYRNPLVMFGLGPIYIVLVRYRLSRKGARSKERVGTHVTSVALLLFVVLLCWTLGWEQFLLVEGPILYFSAVVGIWLFYVQHQFEDGYFEPDENWDYVTAALHGSSYYKLPKILQWITGNIGFHHIHHLGPRIPNYNLQTLCESKAYLQNVPTIGILSSLRSLRYRVWDDEHKKFVGFRGIDALRSRMRP